jgi:hypothetical protein
MSLLLSVRWSEPRIARLRAARLRAARSDCAILPPHSFRAISVTDFAVRRVRWFPGDSSARGRPGSQDSMSTTSAAANFQSCFRSVEITSSKAIHCFRRPLSSGSHPFSSNRATSILRTHNSRIVICGDLSGRCASARLSNRVSRYNFTPEHNPSVGSFLLAGCHAVLPGVRPRVR